MSASMPKATGGVQVISKLSRVSMTTAAVQAHTTAGVNPNVAPICGITEEQSPSGNPNAKAKENRLDVSAQLIGGESGEGGGEGDRKVKQTLKPPLTFEPSETQLSAEASTPSGPSLPE